MAKPRPFFDLLWGDLHCQTLRLKPIKKGGFAALGLIAHLDLAWRCTVCTFGCVWVSPFFDLRWSDLQCQTSRPEPKKKGSFCSCGAQFAPPIAFEIHRLHLPLRLGVTTGKTTTSDPKAFPKRLPPEQGNSRHRFSTCVGVIFNVKRRVQNR